MILKARLRLVAARLPRSAVQVLSKIAQTIKASKPGHTTPGTYTSDSCYGAVAWKLRRHQDDNWYIFLFGDDLTVTHACIYDAHGKEIVDTFNGQPKIINNKVWYIAPGHDFDSYPLVCSISVKSFRKLFL